MVVPDDDRSAMPDDMSGPSDRPAPMPAPAVDRSRGARRRRDRRLNLEVVAAVILALVTILTAWSAFEATKWGGVMSIRFSEANAAPTLATQAAARVNAEQAVDVGLFAEYTAAVSAGDASLATFIEDRFRDEFRPAFEAWLATEPAENPDAPATPFELDEYVLAEQAVVEESAATADLRARQARDANQHGDNYVLLTVLFASVLFFAGVSTKFSQLRVQQSLLVIAVVLLIVGVAFLATFPVEV